MMPRSMSLRTTMLSGIIAAMFFAFQDRSCAKEPKYPMVQAAASFRYLELDGSNVNEIRSDLWSVLVLKSIGGREVEEMRDQLQKTNVALLVVDSFESAKIAVCLGVRKLPTWVLVEEGAVGEGADTILDFVKADFWRAVEVWILVLYTDIYAKFNRNLQSFVNESVILLNKFYEVAPVFHGVTIYVF